MLSQTPSVLSPIFLELLLAGLLLCARRDAPCMAQVSAILSGAGLVDHELGSGHNFDEQLEQGYALEWLERITADLAQLRVPRCWV